ncbi:MAG: metallophosphatase family protein, partial [Acidobacteriota bacterium]|nr:metallophosphatase family protein [Acidobacteriota bacterium]
AVVSDTHGLLRPRVPELLAGCDRILHAGDIGGIGGIGGMGGDGTGAAEILARLRRIAPLLAVRGNTDTGAAAELPAWLAGDLDGLPFHLVHRREDVDPAWLRASRLVVFGHSHRPELEWRGSCLLLNPGSCGPKRFDLPLTLAILRVSGNRLTPEILAVE